MQRHCALVALVATFALTVSAFEFKHHDTEAMLKSLNETHTKCPEISRLYSIGSSVQGRPLAVIEFAADHLGEHIPLRPEFKYVANMHGNEVVGRELLLKLADHLCERHRAGDADVVALLAKTRLHLMPTMNPDGYEAAYHADAKSRGWTKGRENANGVDLNRDFPDLDSMLYYFENNEIPRFDHLMEFFSDESDHQPETMAVGRWILQTPFLLSANIHEGDLVANYPFDLSRVKGSSQYAKTADDATFRELALSYSTKHAHMAKTDHSPCDGNAADAFAPRGGITNGARWYSVKGGMQDFNYLATNCFEITLELSCAKFPPADQLEQLWKDNKASLINFMWQTHTGVKGLISCLETGDPIADAVIWIKNVTADEGKVVRHPVTSGAEGDFFRLLVPGDYELIVQAEGFEPTTQKVTVTAPAEHAEAQRVDVKMEPVGVHDNAVANMRRLQQRDEVTEPEQGAEYENEHGPEEEETQEKLEFELPNDITEEELARILENVY